MSRQHRSTQSFVSALDRLLREQKYGSRIDARLRNFGNRLNGRSAEVLLRVIEGGIAPPPWLVEECASALGVAPDYFAEYRIREAGRLYDIAQVGFERALANFDAWAGQQSDK